jgi:hypothetical protein
MIPYKLNQLDQGLWSEQCRVWVLSRAGGRHRRDGKVCPVPGQGEEEAILTAQDNPGLLLAPEDAADTSLLPAGGTLLGQDRGPCSLKCNIWCDLFGG